MVDFLFFFGLWVFYFSICAFSVLDSSSVLGLPVNLRPFLLFLVDFLFFGEFPVSYFFGFGGFPVPISRTISNFLWVLFFLLVRCLRDVGAAKWDGLRRRFGTRLRRRRRAKLLCCESFGTSQPALNRADFPAEAVPAMRGYSFPLHRGSGDIVATPQSFNLGRASLSSHLRYLAGALRVVPLTRCAVV